ncbi:alternative ribosome rescue aminoacyl-tRNA hydrolase ArfB [Winogradskyella sp. A3E31]|uniref:alternative ribosome rescue aminoacyl-tRNA hydrolase ArfB n=1 Tax=Winogradskyella sp. A3E31 TaxID=3349637 RepID=UPI00398A7C19
MDKDQLVNEVSYKAVRSSGSGGQNVNKVATKVELYFDLANTSQFSDDEKIKLENFFNNRLSKDGVLVLSCGESRSQFRNKSIVTQRFFELLEEGLREEKERIPTKTPKAAKRKRLKNKRINSEKKANRKPPNVD